MANDPMRSKAAAVFGKEFMNVVKGNDPKGNQVNSAQALQKRANARPIPVYKDGGVISKAAVDQARVATRAKAAGYKEGGVKKRADGGSVDRNKARLDRKIADIEKDYQKAQASGKGAVAKAKYEQRMADARDDYAKWTGADRTETRAAESAAEKALTEARRTKGASIIKRDAPSVMAEMVKNEAPIKTAAPADDLAKTIKIETDVARKTGSKPVQRGAASRSNGRTAAPKAERATTPAAAPQKQQQAPSAGRMGSGVNQNVGRAAFANAPAAPAAPAARKVQTPAEYRAQRAAELEARAAQARKLEQADMSVPGASLARLKNVFGFGSSGLSAEARGLRSQNAAADNIARANAQAAAARAQARSGRKADLIKRAAAARAAGNEANAKYYEREASYLKQGGSPVKKAVGGAAKVRKGMMKGK